MGKYLAIALLLGALGIAHLGYVVYEDGSSVYRRMSPASNGTQVVLGTSFNSGVVSGTWKFVPTPKSFTSDPPEIQPPAGHPPLEIIAGAHVFTVHYTTREYMQRNQCSAFTSPEVHKIWLEPGEDRAEMRETMMHELMHAAVYEGGGKQMGADRGDDLTDGHDVINPAAPLMLEIMRDNPVLLKWFTESN